MDVLPWVFSSGWASGINGYAVVLILGLLGRAGADVPAALQRGDVLIAAAVLFAVDLVADKIPYVDSVWDTVHTAIRPTIGAVLGALLAGDAGTLSQAVGATVGGVAALASHLVKAGLRAAVNVSPEPASNVAVSAGEDAAVAGVVAVSVLNPWVAAAIAAMLLGTGAVLVILLVGRIRAYRRQRREQRDRRRRPAWTVRDRAGPEGDGEEAP
jgi:hypothetical protein